MSSLEGNRNIQELRNMSDDPMDEWPDCDTEATKATMKKFHAHEAIESAAARHGRYTLKHLSLIKLRTVDVPPPTPTRVHHSR
jgi:hypothetical protein